MSKKDQIIEAALEIANQEGLEALSVRAVATRLELSPGNVSYHFARKEDLVFALAVRLSEGNAEILWRPIRGAEEFLESFRTTFRRQHAFRGLILSAPHVMEVYPEVRSRYRRSERERGEQLRRRIDVLRDAGHIRVDKFEAERLRMQVALVARFWLSEYRLTHYRHKLERAIDHYLGLMGSLLVPYATPAGMRVLRPYLELMLGLEPGNDDSDAPVADRLGDPGATTRSTSSRS